MPRGPPQATPELLKPGEHCRQRLPIAFELLEPGMRLPRRRLRWESGGGRADLISNPQNERVWTPSPVQYIEYIIENLAALISAIIDKKIV